MDHAEVVSAIADVIGDTVTRVQISKVDAIMCQYAQDLQSAVMRVGTANIAEMVHKGFMLGRGV